MSEDIEGGLYMWMNELQPTMTHDSIGRCVYAAHHREICHDCCVAFDIPNRIVEEERGFIRKLNTVERAAQKYAIAKGDVELFEEYMARLGLFCERAFDEARECGLKDEEDELRRLAQGSDVESAKRAAQELENDRMNQRALIQARSRYPILLGLESHIAYKRRVYWKVASPPPILDSDHLTELYTCAYCRKISTVKLTCCGRCKKSSYCSKACQKVCWKVQKKECIATDRRAKTLPLTWAQLEAHGGRPVEGETLVVRAILDVSTMRQVYICKDRVGDVMQVAAYTNSRSLHPDLKQGSIITWKNPRFHYFNDQSTGARIEEEDLVNITVTNV